MYLWNHSSDVVVNGQTFQDWFIDSYMFNEVGSSPLVSGFFWDDIWSVNDPFSPDLWPNTSTDIGLTTADLEQLTASWTANMDALKERTLSEGKFAWQMLWTGGGADNYGGTCPTPLVKESSCAADLEVPRGAVAAAPPNRARPPHAGAGTHASEQARVAGSPPPPPPPAPCRPCAPTTRLSTSSAP